MIKKIKDYFKAIRDYRTAKKGLTMMLLNQYSDFLEAEIKAKEAEIEAYNQMKVFSESFNSDDLRTLVSGIEKIAESPDLQTAYYEKIHEDNKDTAKNVKADK